MDSLSIAWWKRPQLAITIDYGQKAAEAEMQASAAVCAQLGITHHMLAIDCSSLGSGDMAGCQPNAAAPASDWWPYRNQMLVTFAAMKAIALGATTLYIGTVRSDESHRDGTADFIRILDNLLRYQEGGLRLEAPAIGMTTQQLVESAKVPANVLGWAHSCHKANLPCGNCRGCNKYNQAMFDLGYAGKLH